MFVALDTQRPDLKRRIDQRCAPLCELSKFSRGLNHASIALGSAVVAVYRAENEELGRE